MLRFVLQSVMLSVTLAGAQANAQGVNMNDGEYLQQRAANLNGRIDKAVKQHRLSVKKADKLHLTVGKVQTSAGNLQTRNGTIARADADRMNQDLTNVERILNGERN